MNEKKEPFKLQKTSAGYIVSYLEFCTLDNRDGPHETAKEIELTPEGEIISIFYYCPFGENFKETFKPGIKGEIFKRPNIKSEKSHYLNIVEALRAENAPKEQIKYYISLYEMAIRHEEIDRRREAGIIKTEKTKVSKVWNY